MVIEQVAAPPFPDAAAVFREQRAEMLSWTDGPVFVGQDEEGVLLRTADGQERHVDRAADAVVFSAEQAGFVTLRRDGRSLRITRRPLRGEPVAWDATLPDDAAGSWTITDAWPGRVAGDRQGMVVALETSSGRPAVLDLSPDGPPRLFEAEHPGDPVVHLSAELGVFVVQRHEAPDRPVLAVRPSGFGFTGRTTAGRWLDARGDVALLERDGRPALWRIGSDREPSPVQVDGHLADARFLGAGPDRIGAVVTADGTDRLHLLDLATGARRTLEPGAGRIRISAAHAEGIGLHLASTTGGSTWAWLAPDGTIQTAPGGVAPLAGDTSHHHRWQGRTPIHVHLPGGPPQGAVISLHGGPETVERDELRFGGWYRQLLNRGFAVLAVNYAGSTGYGAEHCERAWLNWEETLREDLAACLDLCASYQVPRARTILLGASFGAAVALLGNAMFPGTAGVIACSPIVDLSAHVHRVVREDPRCRDWFSRRFGEFDAGDPAAGGLARLLRPDRLTVPAGGPVFVLQGGADPVVDPAAAAGLVRRAQAAGLPWRLLAEPGTGHDPDTVERALARQHHLGLALADIVAGWRDPLPTAAESPSRLPSSLGEEVTRP